MKKTTQLCSRILPIVVAVVAAFSSMAIAITSQAEAAPLTQTYLRLSRMSIGTAASVRLVFRTGPVSGATSVVIDMKGADTTSWLTAGGLVNATQTVSSASCVADNAGSTALPGTLAASGNAGTGVITITGVTALTATTTYCVDLTSTSAVTNPTAAGEYHPTITAGIDSTTIASRIISNDSVVITANVPPIFNFVLSSNTDNFTANLSQTGVTTTTGVTATINTNAKSGWIAWAKDTNSGLTSAIASKTIPAITPGTSTTLSSGTEGYATGITAITQGAGAGVTSATAAYDATGSAHGSGLDTNYRRIASSDGTASGAVLTIKERAAISALTPAAPDYTDTMTLIGAGNF